VNVLLFHQNFSKAPKTPQNNFGTEVEHFGTEVKLTSVPKFKPANPHKMGLF
jgi:hypothetical protein